MSCYSSSVLVTATQKTVGHLAHMRARKVIHSMAASLEAHHSFILYYMSYGRTT